jgi:hypothetical protein
MHVNVQEKIRNNPELASAVVQATNLLEAEVGQSNGSVTADWNLIRDDSGRNLIGLTLSDFTGSVAAQFTHDEIMQSPRVEGRLVRLWGDLLQVRSHKQLEKLKQLVQGLEDD